MEDSRQYGQQEFNLPHDVVSLPSQGKFYKNKKKSLKVGYLTAQDENILISIGNSQNSNILNELVKNKIYEPDIRVEDLLEGDLEAVMIFLRNTSFGPDYNFTLRDPKTNKQFNHTIKLDELDFKKPKTEPSEDGLFHMTLPKSGANIKCKLLTVGETQELNDLLKQYPSNVTTPVVTNRLTKQIVSVDDNTDKEFISKFVINLPIMDSKFIRNTLSDSEPKLELERKLNAPSGEELTVRVTFGVEFFRPFF
jgi:hypothetical protein